MPESILRPPARRDAQALADWAEVTMAVEELDSLSRAAIHRRLEEGSAANEAAIPLLLGEVRRRSITRSIYPYSVDSSGISRDDGALARTYDALVMMSLDEAPFRRTKDYGRATRLFDDVVGWSLASCFGPGTRVLRFGTPVSDGRPEEFPAAVEWLATHLGVSVGNGRRWPTTQDGGVDLVVWRPFRDAAGAFPVLLAQCTVETSFNHKGSDINARRWLDWLALGKEPLEALAVPYHLDHSHRHWDEVRYDVQLMLDRFRICDLLTGTDVGGHDQYAELDAWLEDQLLRLRMT